eukprot:364747-Chlamydomonas_euryale.AAC.3
MQRPCRTPCRWTRRSQKFYKRLDTRCGRAVQLVTRWEKRCKRNRSGSHPVPEDHQIPPSWQTAPTFHNPEPVTLNPKP